MSFDATLRDATQLQRAVGGPAAHAVDEKSEAIADNRRSGVGSGVAETSAGAAPAGSAKGEVPTVAANQALRKAAGDGRLSKSALEAGIAQIDAGSVSAGLNRGVALERDAVTHAHTVSTDDEGTVGLAKALIAEGEDLKAVGAKSVRSPLRLVEGHVAQPKAGVKASSAGAALQPKSVAWNSVTVDVSTPAVAAGAAPGLQAEAVRHGAVQVEVAATTQHHLEVSAGAQSERLIVSALPVVPGRREGAAVVDPTLRAGGEIESGQRLGDFLGTASGLTPQTTVAGASADALTLDSMVKQSGVSQSLGVQPPGIPIRTSTGRLPLPGPVGDADGPLTDSGLGSLALPAMVTSVVGEGKSGADGEVDSEAAQVVPLPAAAAGTASRSAKTADLVESAPAGPVNPIAAQQKPASNAAARHTAAAQSLKPETSAALVSDAGGALRQESWMRTAGDSESIDDAGAIAAEGVVARPVTPNEAVTQGPPQMNPISIARPVTAAKDTQAHTIRTTSVARPGVQGAGTGLNRGETTGSSGLTVAGDGSEAGKATVKRSDAAVTSASTSSAVSGHATNVPVPVAVPGADADVVKSVGAAHDGAVPAARDGGATGPVPVGTTTGEALAVASVGVVSSSAQAEGTVQAEAHRTLAATPTVLEVGVPNGTQGWVKIRAEVGSEGQVNASLAAGSSASQEMIHRQLPALNAYLHSEQIAVTATVTERGFASSAGENGGAGQFQSSAGGAFTGGDTGGAASGTGSGAAADAGARDGARAASDASRTSSFDSRAGWDAGLDAGLGEAIATRAGLHESGQWLNVRV